MEPVFRPMTRRTFLKTSAMSAGALVALTIFPQAHAMRDTLKTRIRRNHGHRFMATLSQVISAGPRTYNIRGSSRHPHGLTLTQEMIDTLLARRAIDVESSFNSGHSHMVRLKII